MAAPLRENMTGTAPDGTRVIVRGGKVVRAPPEGTTPRPEYGAMAYETSDGSILTPTKDGSVRSLRGAQTAGAEARTRLVLGFAPTIEAQKNLFEAEEWKTRDQAAGTDRLGSNPLDTMRGALAEELRPADGARAPMQTRISRRVGGQRYQNYNQAAKSFEASFMPILSGAAVTESEAQRLISSALPVPGDTPETLARKAKQRAMMINGAAELLGEPVPFPRVPSMRFKSSSPTGAQGTQAPAQRPAAPPPARRMTDAEIKAALGL